MKFAVILVVFAVCGTFAVPQPNPFDTKLGIILDSRGNRGPIQPTGTNQILISQLIRAINQLNTMHIFLLLLINEISIKLTIFEFIRCRTGHRNWRINGRRTRCWRRNILKFSFISSQLVFFSLHSYEIIGGRQKSFDSLFYLYEIFLFSRTRKKCISCANWCK